MYEVNAFVIELDFRRSVKVMPMGIWGEALGGVLSGGVVGMRMPLRARGRSIVTACTSVMIERI